MTDNVKAYFLEGYEQSRRMLATEPEIPPYYRRWYQEHLTRHLQAQRDFPSLDVGPEPKPLNHRLRVEIIREFHRTA